MIFMKLTHLGFFFVSDKYVSNSVSISPRYCIWFFEKQPRGNFQEAFEGNRTLKINKYMSTAIINLWTNKFKHMIRSAGYELCQSWRFLRNFRNNRMVIICPRKKHIKHKNQRTRWDSLARRKLGCKTLLSLFLWRKNLHQMQFFGLQYMYIVHYSVLQ